MSLGVRLPDGWTEEPSASGGWYLRAPKGGYVTLSFALRTFALGCVHVNYSNCRKPVLFFRGRGWRKRLVAAAIEDLTAANAGG